MATTYKCNEFSNVNTMTPTQVKKHITQMNELEKDLVSLTNSIFSNIFC